MPIGYADDDAVAAIEPAIALVERWLDDATTRETRRSRATMSRLEGVVTDPIGLGFVMDFIDRVARPDDSRVAARQLRAVVDDGPLPRFLSSFDRLLLRAGSRLGIVVPWLVIPLARRRMRSLVGHLIAPADADELGKHLNEHRTEGWASNVNLLGEAVLGDDEASRRHAALIDLLALPDVDYVSVKLSSVVAQLNPWAWEESLDRVCERLAELVDHARMADPPTFVNVDMEEYHDLELTLEAFERVLGHPARHDVEAGIVLQAYLPDALGALQRLSSWAADRVDAGGAPIKVRLVKGANLAMEQVDAAIHGWEQAPYSTKADTDANYVRCLDWVLDPTRLRGLRIGLASHNLFHVAWTLLLAQDRGVGDRVQVEMLQGMAEGQAAAVKATLPDDLRPLLYTPAVGPADFDVAVGYLFRRLDENAAPDNFLRALFDLQRGSAVFESEAVRFRASVSHRTAPSVGPRREQTRARGSTGAFEPGQPFRNDAETDPSLPSNREWLRTVRALEPSRISSPLITDPSAIDAAANRARQAQLRWRDVPARDRTRVLHRIGDELDTQRDLLLRTMADEAGKTFAEADVEICEAIDFARYYAERIDELDHPRARFTPHGLVAVVPPWNFPVAIPAGGVLAALAAGNAVLFKPAPETVRCASIVHGAIIAAGVPPDLCALVRTADDDAGRRVVETADAVILTGSTETADLFRSWDPAMRLFAETSGKNALVITPNADIDLAVADLVRSAFGHAGQKCSAASLAILVGSVFTSPRFRRQLSDAVRSLRVGSADEPGTVLGPLIGAPNERLQRAFDQLQPGETWLVEPTLVDHETNLWSPGVRVGVEPGSWFHRTECFGPVLGLMQATDLDHAIRLQNDTAFGLTGGLHSLDPTEIERWTEAVEVGNAYVNRPITGAIVQRQPFGGWKRSTVGPGAKAGGPNYIAQLGTWSPTDLEADDFEQVWGEHFVPEHDPTALLCERNVFRYRRLRRVLLRHGPDADARDLHLVRHAATTAGVELVESDAASEPEETLAQRLDSLDVGRIRVVGTPIGPALRAAALEANLHLADAPVNTVGRIELLHFVREQAVSTTLHRFGNLPPADRTATTSA